MTLVLNEIHIIDGLNSTMVVAAADRRITNQDGTYHDTQKKLFHIPYLNATISFFGLAEIPLNGKRLSLSNWIPEFIKANSKIKSIENFLYNLQIELNKTIPSGILHKIPSGFHISGYNKGLPDFWYMSNIGNMDQFIYTNLSPKYDMPRSDFLQRDLVKNFGWDGTRINSANKFQIYRNGDIRAHVAVWNILDAALKNLFQFPDFRQPDNPRKYGEYVKFKFEFIAYLYKNWAKKEIIGRPIDVIVLHNLSKDSSVISEIIK